MEALPARTSLLALLAASSLAADLGGERAGWASGLTWVDQLAWAASDQAVDRFVAGAHEADAVFAASWRAGWADRADRAADAPVYAVELTIANDARSYSLREAVVWTNRSAQVVDRLVLRAAPLALPERRTAGLQVWADRRRARFAVDGSLIHVRLPEPLRPGERVRLLVTVARQDIPHFPDDDAYVESVNALGTGAFGRSQGVINLGYALPLVTRVGPDGAPDARPIPAHGEHAWFEPSQFHVLVDAPRKLLLASTGVEIESRTTGERTTTRIVAAAASDFALEASSTFAVVEKEVEGIRVRAFHPQWAPGAGTDLLQDAVASLRHYEGLWGELPYRELDVVGAPVQVALGIEFPQLVTVDIVEQDRRYRHTDELRWTVAHEVAHQWWHAEVGNDPWGEPWVDEALASQAAASFMAATSGGAAIHDQLADDIDAGLRSLSDEGVGILPAGLEAGRYDLVQYGLLVYGKAPLFLDQVRALLGDETYHAALRRYHAEWRLRSARGDDLLEAFRRVAADPAAVDALYRRWMIEVHPVGELLGR